MSIEWTEVNKHNPCPICGRSTWCSISTDHNHVCCRRGDGSGLEKTDKSGGIFWYYYLGEESPERRGDDEIILPPDRSDSKRADLDTLNQVYSSLLNELTLSTEHRENLHGRGLSDDEINRHGYKSLPLQGRSRLAKTLKSKFSTDTLFHVPGFFQKEERGKPWVTIAGSPGILIPVRDCQGRIIGLKIRVDSPKEPDQKYIWLSSSGKPGGTGQANLLHIPLFNGDKSEILRLTEGELKADIATALSGILTLSLPGVGSWRLALSTIKELGVEKVFVALDADAHNNRNVANHLLNLFIELLNPDNELSLKSVCLEIWDTSFKGIDDVLAARKGTQTIEGEAALGIVQGFLKEAIANDPLPTQSPKYALMSDSLTNCPDDIKQHRKPPFWNIDEKEGIWRYSDKEGTVYACPVPVGLSRRLINADTGTEKTEIVFLRDGVWKRLICNNSQLFSNQSCVSLADMGLPISGSNAREFVKYLTQYQGVNLNSIQSARSIGRMGWLDDNLFVPFYADEIVSDITEFNPYASGYYSHGTEEEWVKMALKVRQEFPLARLTMSASFAAPLLKLLNQRVFIIHNWGPTRGGKTSAIKMALSAWGNPEDLMLNFNSTKVAIEKTAGFFTDLPLGIDERQAVGDHQGFIEGIVYLLGLGKGKARGSKNGGLQYTATWRSIVLTSGEEPLANESSTSGIQTRVLEIYGKPISDEVFARKLHAFSGQHFGFAGPLFVKKLIQTDKAWLSRMYESLIDNLNKRHATKIGSHLTALACVAVADLLASQWIFNIPDNQAAEESIKLIEAIFNELETAASVDDANRAYEYLESFFNSNIERFKTGFSNGSKYGFYDVNAIYLYPTSFQEIMELGGFNLKRIINDWKNLGWIITETRTNEKWPRIKIRKADPYNSGAMSTFYAIKKGVL
jgi:hypothetical protein